MLRNHLLILWRNARRQPLYSLLNIFGLSLGIAACLFIFLYLDFELNYDYFHQKADNIYQIHTNKIKTRERNMDVDWMGVPAPLGPAMQKDYPEVENYVRLFDFLRGNEVNFQYRGKHFREEEVYAADASLLDIFSIDFIKGNAKNALNGPNKIILSQSMAEKIFGTANPLNKTLKTTSLHNNPSIDTSFSFIVTGIYKDMPGNTQIYAEAIISAETDPTLSNYYYNSFNFYTYVLLNPDADVNAFAAKLSDIYDNYLDANREPVLVRAGHTLTPLQEIHLNTSGGLNYIYIFVAVGLLTLLITAISYVNLSTAQAAKRATEVGIRKVLGSYKRQLRIQFLVESIILALLATLLGVTLVESLIDPVNEGLNLQLNMMRLLSPQLLGSMLGIVLTIGIISGGYPAFLLAAFEPIHVLKGYLSRQSSKHLLRKVLISAQLGIVIFVLICTATIYDQLDFLRQKDLGFEKHQILMLSVPTNLGVQQHQVFKNTLLESPEILSVSGASFTPGVSGMIRRPVSVETPKGPEQKFIRSGRIDDQFLKTMGISLLEGRNFSTNFPTDTTESVLINETWKKQFQLTNPIGTKIRLGDQNNPHFFRVIGVISDFHQSSLHTLIEPQMFRLNTSSELVVKVGTDLPKAIKHISTKWKAIFPNTPFEYTFLDEGLETIYEQDQVRGKIFFAFSLISIFITFMGLFGLTSQIATQRAKEIGIRKVLGAETQDIIFLMGRDFIAWVGIAALPASIFAWYIIKQWLQNFAYQTPINYLLFIGIVLLILVFTLSVTSWYAIKTSNIRPAESLKND